MSRRYASVDRSKEIKAKRDIIPPFSRRNLVLNINNFDINNILNQSNQNTLRTLNTNRYNSIKLPLINKQITSSHLGDINSKNSDLSTEVNNAFSFEREMNDNNKNILKTEANNNDNYFKLVINSDFSKRKTVNNSHLNSGKKILKPKIIIRNENKEDKIKIKYLPILKSERLYPKMNKDKNSINILKTIKAIRNNNLVLKRNNNPLLTMKKDINNDNIAYESKFENIVFDANKLLNKHNFKENDLKINDNMNSFIDQNKELCLNNLLIKLIKKKNKNLKENFEIRNKEVEKFKTTLTNDEKDFETYIIKQKNLYYKTSDLLNQIHIKNYNLIRIFYEMKSKSRILEDEIFKMIEQIESLRIYAKFVTKVLGGNDKLFDGDLIPDYENLTKLDINTLVKKVYDKYGNLLKKHKLSMTSNSYYTINNIEKNNNEEINSQDETIEEIDVDLLNDPLFMVRKFKDIEERILFFVEKSDIFTKYANKEYDFNEQTIKELKLRIIKLNQELEYSKKSLNDYKNIVYQNVTQNNENQEFYSLIKDLCINIFNNFQKGNIIEKEQKDNNKSIDIFELNDDVSKCINILVKREEQINNYINNLETYEKTDRKLFYEIMNNWKNELKFMNQNKNKENLNIGDNKKYLKIYEKFNKIIIKSKKSEPPYYKIKKEVIIKEDPKDIINREKLELITYK